VLPLFRFGATRRNDADNFGAIIVVQDAVRHQKQQIASDQSYGLPTELSVFNMILLNQCERIGKNLSGSLETDAMLDQIGFCLCCISFKSCLHSKMYLHLCSNFKSIWHSAAHQPRVR
jgi:hypothetical protein